MRHYDSADAKQNSVDLCDENWDICYSSDLHRAIQTAKAICDCKIITTEDLREVPISPILNTNLKIPIPLWLVLGRMAWFYSHSSQPETKKQTTKRINSFLTQIMSMKESNILIVTHGFLISLIQKELVYNGFKGRRVFMAQNGTLYVFEKSVCE